MVNRIQGGSLDGIDGCGVIVEIDAGRGLPCFQIVGLPNAAVRESRERVMAAVRNSGYRWPQGRVVISLLPADKRKQGASLDLAIAVGICTLDAANPIARVWRRTALLGELSLSGALRPVRGLLSMVQSAASGGCDVCVVPRRQQDEAALVRDVEIVGAATLREAVDWYLEGRSPAGPPPTPPKLQETERGDDRQMILLDALPGDRRRLAELAAAGRHNLLLYGPPGTGKTRLARLIADLQPPMRDVEAMAVARIHGAAGSAAQLERLERPFRAPHHTVTRAGLIGGGASMVPGEATLAHHGVLFLDEIAEFRSEVLDVLREPLESGRLLLSRAQGRCVWPADFQLLAAMNPCRCGFHGSPRRPCRCTPAEVARYQGRLSGPLLDRIDIFAEVDTSPDWSLRAAGDPDRSSRLWRETRRRISAARRALEPGLPDGAPSSVRPDLATGRGWLDDDGLDYLETARSRLDLSVRGVLRCLQVARTLAALDGEVGSKGSVAQASPSGSRQHPVTCRHLGEALALRGVSFRSR